MEKCDFQYPIRLKKAISKSKVLFYIHFIIINKKNFGK